jgi:hypothetical protein
MGNNHHGTTKSFDEKARSAVAAPAAQVNIGGRKPGQLKMIPTDMPGTFGLVLQDDQETMPCHIFVDSANIDDLILTNKVRQLLCGFRTVTIAGGLSEIFGLNPNEKEIFYLKYHYVSAKEITKVFNKYEDVNIFPPVGTKLEFTSVVYKGRDFTVEASTLLVGSSGVLQLSAGSVESALCGRFILDIDTATDQFVFVYKLHSVPSISMSCLLTEEFYIPPAPSFLSPNLPTTKSGAQGQTTQLLPPSLLLPAGITFNTANAMAAMAEPFRPDMLSKF